MSEHKANRTFQRSKLAVLAYEVSQKRKYDLEAFIRLDLLRWGNYYSKAKEAERLKFLRDNSLCQKSTNISITNALVEHGFEKAAEPQLEDIRQFIQTILKESRAHEAHESLYGVFEKVLQSVTNINVLQEVLGYISFSSAEIMKKLNVQAQKKRVEKNTEKIKSMIIKRAKQVTNEEIASQIQLASQAGLEIPTHPDNRYTLLVTPEFFARGELNEDRLKYGDRFNLNSVSGKTSEQFIENILAKAQGIENRTVALVPADLPSEQLEKLTKAGIRFIRTDAQALLDAKVKKDKYREKFQLNTYAMMLLVRRIGKDINKDSSIYQMLDFYIKSHFGWKADKMVSVKDYIQALITGNVAILIKGYLSYRPAEPYDVPDYETIAAKLTSA